MTKELTPEEYDSTMTGKMADVTETAEPVVDIWPYVERLVKEEQLPEIVLENELVECVYGNEDNSFHHVLLPANGENVYVVLIVDVKEERIKGHFCLNLNKEYGLA